MSHFFHAKRWYWICQLVGWIGFWATQVQASVMLDRYQPATPLWLAGLAGLGLLLTHGYRALLLRFRVLAAPLGWQAGAAALGLVALSLLMQVASSLLTSSLSGKGWHWSGASVFAFGVVAIGRYLIVWVLAYHFFVVGERLARAEVRELRAEAARRQAELDLLRSQINPHFLFNALNSVRALTLTDPHRARTAVTQLADLLRYTLSYEQRQLIPLAEELAAVRDYLALEQTRFGPERLQVQCDVPEALLTWPVPPAALLTLVENAVKHGISNRPSGGVLHLVATRSSLAAEHLQLEVSQPGHLAPMVAPRPAGHVGGLGLLNTRQRLHSLYGDTASLTLQENPVGTVVARLGVPATPLS
ncbi:sensor histidine kinase [Hymenobacter terrenus]|uniref:sensor histidine kinase n=1 Tax=Hymenobacter terrenus TaxID=1629124 RepID=UPI000619BE1B|nr:histidine kinase [Hymenobacter terrenus]